MTRIFVVLGLLIAATAARADAVLDQARQLMAQGNPRAAFELLGPLERERAGEPDYDYLLGIAALDAGQATRAVFALERVLAVNPNHAQARAEIARAYFVLGERRAAKQEFESVQKLAIPEEARATIQKFLSAIEAAGAGDRPAVNGFLEIGAGYDSNINAGPGGGNVAVPVFGGQILALDPLAVERSSAFLSLSGGVSMRYPLRPGVAVVGGLFGTAQSNRDAHQFDTSDMNGHLGLGFSRGRDSVTVAFQADRFYLDDARYRDATGGLLQWTRIISDFDSATAYGQYSRLDYADAQGIRDAERWVAGGALGHSFAGSLRPVGYLGAYAGTDDEINPGVPWLGDDFWGLRVGGQVTVAPGWTAFAAASLERRYYGGPDPLFLVTRGDSQADLRLGASYRPAEGWVITPVAAYTRNASNIPIYEYDRWTAQVLVRREFP
jgi:tetratricopeptide (TPR) repeat protein